jgi:anthranilate phosphoribosyltransferase
MSQIELIQSVIEQQNLSAENMTSLFNDIVLGNMSDIELSALLTALKIKGETAEEIYGAASALINNATPFDSGIEIYTDNCGTGGDGSNTINISTTSAIVAASLGIKMAKHGNRSVSSKSGSADVLNELGINVKMSPTLAKRCLDETNLTFLMAPIYHSGIRHAMPVRQTLKLRTLFNILGPLLNPAGAQIQLLGVYDDNLREKIAHALKLLGKKSAWVVHGSGMDEMALHGSTNVSELQNGQVKNFTLTPEDFGLKTYSIDSLAGGTPQQNAEIIRNILEGKGTEAHNSAIAINTAPLILLNGLTSSYKEASSLVMDALKSGVALPALSQFAALSQSEIS